MLECKGSVSGDAALMGVGWAFIAAGLGCCAAAAAAGWRRLGVRASGREVVAEGANAESGTAVACVVGVPVPARV